jgi:hypothetical protein
MFEPLPALIISYNRPEKFRSLLEQCELLGLQKIYIAIDGTDDLEIQKSYASVLRDFTSTFSGELLLLQREQNLGLAVAVITAIDCFFEIEEKGIILEDDLYFDKDFLKFCDDALLKFEKDERVFMVSGNQFFSQENELESISFGHYPLIWGWATWQDRWKTFRKCLEDNSILNSPIKITPKVKFYWLMGAKRALSCEVNSWAILLATFLRFREHICIYPNCNLVSNVGNDTSASHTRDFHWTLNLPIVPVEILNLNLHTAINITKEIEKDIYGIRYRHRFFRLKLTSSVIAKLTVTKSVLLSRLSSAPIGKFQIYE